MGGYSSQELMAIFVMQGFSGLSLFCVFLLQVVVVTWFHSLTVPG